MTTKKWFLALNLTSVRPWYVVRLSGSLKLQFYALGNNMFFECFSNLKSGKLKGKLGLGWFFWRKVRVRRWVFVNPNFSQKNHPNPNFPLSFPFFRIRKDSKNILYPSLYLHTKNNHLYFPKFVKNLFWKLFLVKYTVENIFYTREMPKNTKKSVCVCVCVCFGGGGLFFSRPDWYAEEKPVFLTRELNLTKTSLYWWYKK